MNRTWALAGVAAVLLAMLALPLGLRAQAQIQVIGHECDKNGGVRTLHFIVANPGVVSLSWDNQVVCGKGA